MEKPLPKQYKKPETNIPQIKRLIKLYQVRLKELKASYDRVLGQGNISMAKAFNLQISNIEERIETLSVNLNNLNH